MGAFYVTSEIAGIRHPKRWVAVPTMLVDTGTEFTWVPETLLKQAGVTVAKKDRTFVMANGQTITRSLGYALIMSGAFETVDEVVFAQTGDLTLLGARTLEGFGATVDARRRRLVASGPHLAAPSGERCSNNEALLERR
jgi:predicted aspartyl protease